MLSKYDSVWKNTQEKRDSDMIDPAPGRYLVRVENAGYSEVKGKDGLDYDRFFWKLQILEGEHAESCFARTEFLPPNPEEAAQKIAYIKGALLACGVCPPQAVTDLPQSMQLCAGSKLEAVVVDSNRTDKTGKVIKNIKFFPINGSQSEMQAATPAQKPAPAPAPMAAYSQYAANVMPEYVPF